MNLKNVAILGSTGSIGVNTLKVVKRFPDRFRVIALTAYNNFKLLREQITQFHPRRVVVGEEGISYLKDYCGKKEIRIGSVQEELEEIASLKEVDIVVIAIGGSRALGPFLSAVRSGKIVATANKEALVIAGDILMREAKRHKAKVFPIDSEQSAIFQCLNGGKRDELAKIYLTASGGCLLNVPKSKFDRLSVNQILRHPRWKMGRKITVDSATLMNKGFEVIEAKSLFSLNIENIEVVIHPEAVIHSMVEFRDGTIIAQLGITDMRLPIQYALTYPERLPTDLKRMNFFELKQLNFQKPNFSKFPALALAMDVAKKGGTLPSVLNASDEEAVDAFLGGRIPFSNIYRVVEKVVLRHKIVLRPDIRAILEADHWAREQAKQLITN